MRKKIYIHEKASAAHTATFNGEAFDAGAFDDIISYIAASAVSGTTPSMTAKLQGSYDDGTTWFDIPSVTFGAISTVSNTAIRFNGPIPRTCRWVYTISGTTPSFTFAHKTEGCRTGGM